MLIQFQNKTTADVPDEIKGIIKKMMVGLTTDEAKAFVAWLDNLPLTGATLLFMVMEENKGLLLLPDASEKCEVWTWEMIEEEGIDLDDSILPTLCPEGCEVEPDGICPHGFASPLMDLGII